MLRRISIGVAVAALSSLPALAQVQQTPQTPSRSLCGDRNDIVERLGSKYKERPYQIGVTSDGKLLEVFASPTGTWTMLMTGTDGRSCLVIHGEGWKPLTTARKAPAETFDESGDDN